jgi:predicted DNA-binding ribbon-helix-helix protein
MCEIYVKADPIHYELRTRSIRIHGVVTSVRLENLCWDILARIALMDGLTTNQLICSLHDEVIAQQGKIGNFSSFLRISCMRYLSNVAQQKDKELLLLAEPDAAAAHTPGRPKSPAKPSRAAAVVLDMAGNRAGVG